MTKDRRARTDGRLSRMLHVLLHMARQDVAFTSDQIAKMLNTNPVLVRRTMAAKALRCVMAAVIRVRLGRGGACALFHHAFAPTRQDRPRSLPQAQV